MEEELRLFGSSGGLDTLVMSELQADLGEGGVTWRIIPVRIRG